MHLRSFVMNAILFGLGLACGVALAAAGAAIAYGKRNLLLGGVVFLVGIAVVLGMFLLNAKNSGDEPGGTDAPVLINTPEPTRAPDATDPSTETDNGETGETPTPGPEGTHVEEPTDVPGTPTEVPTEAPTEKPTPTPTPEPGQYLKVGYDPSTILKPDNWNGSVIYLSFDDGPSYVTEKVLDNLAKYNVKATFFVVGNDFNGSRGNYIKRALSEGHNVGIHSQCHEYNIIYVSVEAFFKDFDMVRDSLRNHIGFDPNISRFPGGASNGVSKKYCTGIMTELTRLVPERGFQYFDWNVSPEDAMSHMTAQEICDAVFKELRSNRPANVVLMHDYEGQDTTAEALDLIIPKALAEGYAFDRLTYETTPAIQHGVIN